MSIEFGFFESVEDDRLYYSDSFNKYFEGMYEGVSSYTQYSNDGGSGVFPGVGNALRVIPGSSPLQVVVTAGKAMVDYHWFEMKDETVSLTLDQNDMPWDRCDVIVLRCNSTNSTYHEPQRSPTDTPARSINIAVVKGNANDSVWRDRYGAYQSKGRLVPPELDMYEKGSYSDDGIYEMPLAFVNVRQRYSGMIAATDITNVAPVIRGILNSASEVQTYVDNYVAKMEELYNNMLSWEDRTKSDYNKWFYDVTDNQLVTGFIQSYHKYVSSAISNSILLDMTGYEYESDDVFIVTYNGLTLTKGEHYSINVNGGVSTLQLVSSKIGTGTVNDLDILVLKTNISKRKEGTLASATGDYYVYAVNVNPGKAYGFKINNIPSGSSETPVISYSNRNLAMIDGMESFVSSDNSEISLTNNGNGTFTITGQNATGSDIVFSTTVSTRAFARANIYNISCTGSGDGGSIDGDPAVIFSIENEDGSFVKTSVDDDPVFDITDETFGDTVVFKITVVDGAGVDENLGLTGMNYTINPMVEVGDVVHDFVRHTYGEFTYGSESPTFSDDIVFVWPKEDPYISKLQLIYYVLADGSADEIEY